MANRCLPRLQGNCAVRAREAGRHLLHRSAATATTAPLRLDSPAAAASIHAAGAMWGAAVAGQRLAVGLQLNLRGGGSAVCGGISSLLRQAWLEGQGSGSPTKACAFTCT